MDTIVVHILVGDGGTKEILRSVVAEALSTDSVNARTVIVMERNAASDDFKGAMWDQHRHNWHTMDTFHADMRAAVEEENSKREASRSTTKSASVIRGTTGTGKTASGGANGKYEIVACDYVAGERSDDRNMILTIRRNDSY